jgi:transposase
LRRLGATHRYVPLLTTIPGIAWVLAYTIAAEIGDIARFPSPRRLAGYTGLCRRVYQSGESDRRGPLSKQGPRYLRWALIEATSHASHHPAYRHRYEQTKRRLGKQRGPKVAQVDLAGLAASATGANTASTPRWLLSPRFRRRGRCSVSVRATRTRRRGRSAARRGRAPTLGTTSTQSS